MDFADDLALLSLQPSTDAGEDKWTASHLFTSGLKYI